MQRYRLALIASALVLSCTFRVGAQQQPSQGLNAIPPGPGAQNPTSAPQAPPAQPNNNSAIVPGSTIEPGDVLSIQVYGDQSLTQSDVVGADGAIAYPLIGRVHVAGQTPAAAAATITQKLKKYVRQPSVNVAITQAGEEGVLVLGGVKIPGRYQIRSGGHLTDAIAAAGGLGPTNGDLPDVRVTQPNGSVKDVSLQKLLHDGDGTLNIPLPSNAIVYVVGANPIMVEVVGAVDHPGNVQIDEGSRLSMAIAQAGTSPNVYSDLNHVVITRTGTDGKTSKQEINMYNFLKGGDKKYDPVLQKGDVVYVPMGKRPGGSGVFNPLDLINRAIGIP